MLNSRSGPNGQAVNVLNGPALRRMLHGKTSTERAQIAAQLIEHRVGFVDLSPAQVARLVDTNPGCVSIVLGHAGTRGPRNKTIERLVKKYGPDVLMRALDQATTPPQQIAAE
jgi:hypothetical protein